MDLDTTDLKILAILQRDSKITNSELASRINLSPSPCLARVRRLEKSGMISNYVALVNPALAGLVLNVFIFITLKAQNREKLRNFEDRIGKYDEVMECYLMTGEDDYLLRVMLPDVSSLERFIIDKLSPIPEVEHIRSSISLKQVCYKTVLPLA